MSRIFLPGQEMPAAGRVALHGRARARAAALRRRGRGRSRRGARRLRPPAPRHHRHLGRQRRPGRPPAGARRAALRAAPSADRRLLHARSTSIEGAALFNPSMVAHPDQSGLPAGSTRFLMTLRAVGEGHISSIELRTGVIDAGRRGSSSTRLPSTPSCLRRCRRRTAGTPSSTSCDDVVGEHSNSDFVLDLLPPTFTRSRARGGALGPARPATHARVRRARDRPPRPGSPTPTTPSSSRSRRRCRSAC